MGIWPLTRWYVTCWWLLVLQSLMTTLSTPLQCCTDTKITHLDPGFGDMEPDQYTLNRILANNHIFANPSHLLKIENEAIQVHSNSKCLHFLWKLSFANYQRHSRNHLRYQVKIVTSPIESKVNMQCFSSASLWLQAWWGQPWGRPVTGACVTTRWSAPSPDTHQQSGDPRLERMILR